MPAEQVCHVRDISIIPQWHATDNLLFDFAPGRTTFVNTLCGQQVLESKDADDAANAHIEEGVRIKPVTVGKLLRVHTSLVTVVLIGRPRTRIGRRGHPNLPNYC